MARIADAEIERLKNEISVERLIEHSGIELKKSGKDWAKFSGSAKFSRSSYVASSLHKQT